MPNHPEETSEEDKMCASHTLSNLWGWKSSGEAHTYKTTREHCQTSYAGIQGKMEVSSLDLVWEKSSFAHRGLKSGSELGWPQT